MRQDHFLALAAQADSESKVHRAHLSAKPTAAVFTSPHPLAYPLLTLAHPNLTTHSPSLGVHLLAHLASKWSSVVGDLTGEAMSNAILPEMRADLLASAS